MQYKKLFPQNLNEINLKVDLIFTFSLLFFVVCTILDFSMTTIGSGGDWTMEGNLIAQFWWKTMGSFRFIEIPVWMALVSIMTFWAYTKNKFLGLLWLNVLAFNHLFGFVTWLPYDVSSLITFIQQLTFRYPIGFLSVICSIPLTSVQIAISAHNQNTQQ